jgi:hypothetical protein
MTDRLQSPSDKKVDKYAKGGKKNDSKPHQLIESGESTPRNVHNGPDAENQGTKNEDQERRR